MIIKRILTTFAIITSLLVFSGCSRFNQDESLNTICDILQEETREYEETLFVLPWEHFNSMSSYKSMVSRVLRFLGSLETTEDRLNVRVSLLNLESNLSEYLLYEELNNRIMKETFGRDSSQGWTPLSANQNYLTKIQTQKTSIRVASAQTRLSCSVATSTAPSQDDLDFLRPQ